MKKQFKKILFLILGLMFILPQALLADGMIVPPPDYWMQETDQKAVIFYDKGVETMVLSITFKGDANDFAWVVPVPSKPTVQKGSDKLFTSLQALTAYTQTLPNLGLGLGAAEDLEKGGVTVIETKQIEYYDVTTLSSTDKDSLTKWLNDNGYNFPSSASYILDSYIQNNWYFVAMKINPESLGWSNVSQQLRTGHAVPVALSFETKNIVYPLKISSVDYYFEEEKNNDEFNYYIKKYDTVQKYLSKNIISNSLNNWAQDYSTLFDFFLTFQATLTSDLLHRNEYSKSVASATPYISQEKYNQVLDEINKSPFVAKNIITSNNDFSEYVHYLMTTNWPEIDKDREQISQLNIQSKNGQSITTAKQEIALWQGKVNQHVENGLWVTDPDGVSGAEINKLAYCRKWYPDTTEVIMDDIEYIEGFRGRGNTGNNAAEIQTYKCYSGTAINNTNTDLTNSQLPTNVNLSPEQKIIVSPKPSNVTVALYVLADHKKTLSNFTTDWAGWVEKEIIEEWAQNDQGSPWIEPSSDKYFLTKLSRTMSYSEMSEDLFLQNAEDNNPVNSWKEEESSNKEIFFIILMIISGALTLGIAIILIWQYGFKK